MRGSILTTTLSVALVACGGGGTQPGDSCDSNNPCSKGQVCDLTDPGGPACLDGTGDLDSDGIPNDKDHCQHLAGGAYDEDGDGIGDDCDACPIAKPPATAETDGDGVDAPCDPDPKTPGDKIVLFQGFNAPLPDTWKAAPDPNWQVVGGEAIMTPGATNAIEQLTVPVTPSAHMAIFASYRIDQVAAGATNADVAVTATDHLPMGDTTIICGGSRIGTNDLLRVQINTTGTGTNTENNTPAMNLFDPASRYGLLEQIDGGKANCVVTSAKDNNAVSSDTTGESMNAVGLYARSATARFAYVLVVER